MSFVKCANKKKFSDHQSVGFPLLNICYEYFNPDADTDKEEQEQEAHGH